MLPLIYDQLRTIAERQLGRRASPLTLQPTALVHEAYLRLAEQSRAVWKDEQHFMAVAATMMRRVLIDHVRHRNRQKRGGERERITVAAALAEPADQPVDVEALHEALERLEATDPRKGSLVEMRFFGGLSIEQAADMLDISLTTAKREWTLARGWLYRELFGDQA